MQSSFPSFGCGHVLGALLLSLMLLGNGDVQAQAQSKDEQKCTNAMNKDLQKVAAAAGKDANSCIKDFAKDKPVAGGTAESCLTADAKGKVAKATGKTEQDFTRKCAVIPPYGVTDPNTVNAAALEKELNLVHDVFGEDLDAALLKEADAKDASKCQQAVIKAVLKCQGTQLKAYNSCKKDGLKLGSIQGSADLAACIGVDPKGKIAKACDPATGKIRGAIEKKCTGKSVDLSDAFPGCETDDAAELHTCLSEALECRTCLALKQGDGLSSLASCGPCDVGIPDVPIGFHQGVLSPIQPNGFPLAFCAGGDRDGEFCTDTAVHSDCPGPPSPKSRCFGDSHAILNTVIAQPQLTLALVGGLDVNCDLTTAPDPVTGKVDCRCDLVDLVGQDIRPIGFVCFSSFPGCAGGELDCDGGNPMDLEQIGDHNVGICGLGDDPNEILTNPGTGNAECDALCLNYCTSLGAGFTVLDAGCEGYCQSGPRENMSCDFDVDCPEGSCGGGDPTAHGNNCFCSCVRTTGNPSRPGALNCQAGVQINIEQDPPCMVEDGINDITIFLPRTCVPLTTERSTGVLNNADRLGKTLMSGERIGVPGSCEDLATSVAAGIDMAGNVIFWDSTIGDLQTGVITKVK